MNVLKVLIVADSRRYAYPERLGIPLGWSEAEALHRGRGGLWRDTERSEVRVIPVGSCYTGLRAKRIIVTRRAFLQIINKDGRRWASDLQWCLYPYSRPAKVTFL